jgi:hypothetical protein
MNFVTSSRTVTAVIAAAVSIAVSAALAVYLDTFLFFLFVPFVPLVFNRSDDEKSTGVKVRECPACGFRTREDTYSYCPRDGEKLRTRTVYQD